MTDSPTTEQWLPEPPLAPRYEERILPLCPTCDGLCRRDLGPLTADGPLFGPWRCDLHGLVAPKFQNVEVSAGYDDEG